MTTDIAAPTDTTTGEAYIKAVKKQIIELNFYTETNNLNGSLAKAEDLVLFIKGF